MADEAMNVRGPCASCGAQLASDQRYCVECGHRVGPPLALPYALPAAGTAAPSRPGTAACCVSRSPRRWPACSPPWPSASGSCSARRSARTWRGSSRHPHLPWWRQLRPRRPRPGRLEAVADRPRPPRRQLLRPRLPPRPRPGPRAEAEAAEAAGDKKKEKKQKPAPITFSGTVVRVNPVAQSYTVSSSGGLIAIHADTLPKVGDQVESPVRKLNNGTYAENGGRNPVGSADVASFQGTVTYCGDLEHPATPCSNTPTPDDHFVYAVSGLGASVLVSSPPGAALPPVGSQVQVGVHIGSTFAPIDPESPDDWIDYPAPCNPVSSEQSGVPAAPTTATDLTQTSLTVNPSEAERGAPSGRPGDKLSRWPGALGGRRSRSGPRPARARRSGRHRSSASAPWAGRSGRGGHRDATAV